jgi:hypothetical protein
LPGGVAAYVARSGDAAGQCVAFYPQDGRMALAYYLQDDRTSGAGRLAPVYPNLPWSSVRPYVERYATPSRARLRAIAGSCPVLWLIASHEGLRDGPPASVANYRRYLAFLSALRRLYPRSRERSFGWAAVIRVERFDR